MDEVHDYHNFRAKLTQPAVLSHVVEYVKWQSALRSANDAGAGDALPAPPESAPISINLDLTTACNYRCDHCIDWDILNSGVKHKEEELLDSLRAYKQEVEAERKRKAEQKAKADG